ncbi:MAG: hypothetical protein HUU35_07125 [Armatimonadetes bacterium]|nr:hypothetical protein [Armatimonadota bacterium]
MGEFYTLAMTLLQTLLGVVLVLVVMGAACQSAGTGSTLSQPWARDPRVY